MEHTPGQNEADRRAIIHDIKNQLSGITLALEQLQHELKDPSDDAVICFEIIISSCTHINTIISEL